MTLSTQHPRAAPVALLLPAGGERLELHHGVFMEEAVGRGDSGGGDRQQDSNSAKSTRNTTVYDVMGSVILIRAASRTVYTKLNYTMPLVCLLSPPHLMTSTLVLTVPRDWSRSPACPHRRRSFFPGWVLLGDPSSTCTRCLWRSRREPVSSTRGGNTTQRVPLDSRTTFTLGRLTVHRT